MNPSVIGLGIESSCDETSVAVVANGQTILSNIVYSQIPEHAPFRGVVPEIASRSHLEKINEIYLAAMTQAGVEPENLDYVAVTTRPGLTGSLMMGGVLAKSLGLVHGIPAICVDHLEAHLSVINLEPSRNQSKKQGYNEPEDMLGLLLSGGNSSIYRMTKSKEGLNALELIGDTTDDALGEAFDKAASVLDLPYPGGPHIEKAAALCDEGCRSTPALFSPLLKNLPEKEIAFSFSGIKTAVIRAHREGAAVEKICYDFQNTVFDLVVKNIRKAVKKTGIRNVIASGGVLANGELRRRLDLLAMEEEEGNIHYPEQKILCTDNGAMVAARGYELFQGSDVCTAEFEVSSRR